MKKLGKYFVGALACLGLSSGLNSPADYDFRKINSEKNLGYNLNEEWVNQYVSKTFVDTEKPNAVFTIPKEDKNNSFRSKENRNLLEKISSVYDVNFKILSNEKDLYSVLEDTPNTELLVIEGHGWKGGIVFELPYEGLEKLRLKLEELKNPNKSFKNELIPYDPIQELLDLENTIEESYLNIEDYEIQKYLLKLAPNATVFLNSCESGRYGLVDKIKKLSRKDISVLGHEDIFSPSQIKVNSLRPFRVSLEGKIVKIEEGKFGISYQENSKIYMR